MVHLKDISLVCSCKFGSQKSGKTQRRENQGREEFTTSDEELVQLSKSTHLQIELEQVVSMRKIHLLETSLNLKI